MSIASLEANATESGRPVRPLPSQGRVGLTVSSGSNPPTLGKGPMDPFIQMEPTEVVREK
jgi:hypothetical protein